MNKQKRHEAIRERARAALRDLYHNATPSYPSLDDEAAERFQYWFDDAAQFEIEYIKDGGAYGRNYRKTLEHPANAGKYASQAARDFYIRSKLRARDLEQVDCGAFTGWDAIELAAGNKARAKILKKIFKTRPMHRNNSLWERISDYGRLYQWGRGGRTLAPDDLIRQRGGSSFSANESYADEMPISAVVDLIRVIESFNNYVSAWCASVPEQWAELERERRAEERAERKAARDKKRAAAARLERCESYVG